MPNPDRINIKTRIGFSLAVVCLIWLFFQIDYTYIMHILSIRLMWLMWLINSAWFKVPSVHEIVIEVSVPVVSCTVGLPGTLAQNIFETGDSWPPSAPVAPVLAATCI